MKRPIYILLIFLAGPIWGQASFNDREEFSQHMMTLVAEVTVDQSIEMGEGVIYVQVDPGDQVAIWDASGVAVLEKEVTEAHELEMLTDYLLGGRYYLGVKKYHMAPVVKAFDVAYSMAETLQR